MKKVQDLKDNIFTASLNQMLVEQKKKSFEISIICTKAKRDAKINSFSIFINY